MTRVPFESGPHPKLAFLAEAPGDDEMDTGRPLTGPSGRVFNSLLRAANIERRECWVGNVFETQAPGNDTSEWQRDPSIREPALARLSQELQDAKPNVIVPLGGTALWALRDASDISAYRGTILPATRLLPGAKLVPTFHPAHVLRQWKYFAVVVGDLLRASYEADEGPAIVYPKRKLWIAPTLAEIRAYVDRALVTDLPLGVDIETGYGQITCIGVSIGSDEAMCIPFVDNRKPNRSYWGSAEFELQAWKEVKRIIESPKVKIGQNFAGYDWLWLLDKWGINTMNLLHDTRLQHHALYPELPKSLQFMASYTNQGPWKTLGWRGTEKKDD